MVASVDDLKVYMDRGLNNRQIHSASVIIDGLVSELESHLRRPVEVGTFTEEYVIPADFTWQQGDAYTGINPGSLLVGYEVFHLSLRNSPVHSVVSVERNEESLTLELDYVVRRWGIDLSSVASGDVITVEYVAGLDAASIAHLKLLVLRAAAREMQNMTDDVIGIKGDLQTRATGPAVTGFTADEIYSIRKYRRIRIV